MFAVGIPASVELRPTPTASGTKAFVSSGSASLGAELRDVESGTDCQVSVFHSVSASCSRSAKLDSTAKSTSSARRTMPISGTSLTLVGEFDTC